MGTVRILERSVAERIAAGEVIERPASVVKELVENSIDAGSTRIAVEITAGGQKEIRVSDDGTGMSREDALLSLERFATSKINSLDDLGTLSSLGFRGEALPSIAAVSEMEILTRERDAGSGCLVRIEGGKIIESAEAGCPPGTSILVRRLFYNTPARRKFLKSPQSETAFIADLLGKMALPWREISFKLNHDGREGLSLASRMSPADRLARVLRLQDPECLSPLEHTAFGMRITGFVAGPESARSNRAGQYFYLNGRLIRSPLLSQALQDGFATLLPQGRFPVGAVFLEVNGAEVDVNVHPTKAEVRFSNSSIVFKAVSGAVKSAMGGGGAAAPSGPLRPHSDSGSLQIRDAGTFFDLLYAREEFPQIRGEGVPLEQPPSAQARPAEAFRPLGQAMNTYIVGLDESGLVILDQHAADERLQYEKLKGYVYEGGRTQMLLFPCVVELSGREAALLAEEMDFFTGLGFVIEEFGDSAFSVRGVPSGMERLSAPEVLRQALESSLENGAGVRAPGAREELLKSLACEAAVQGGQPMGMEEMEVLGRRILSRPDLMTCPHGRPVFKKFNRDDLDKLFKRK